MVKRRKRRDPRKGTGKKPKGSGRRLYTDENPKDTVRIKFATAKDARATVRKVKRVRKSYARKIQILTVGEQRARVMGKKTVASIFKSAKAGLRKARKRKGGRRRKAAKKRPVPTNPSLYARVKAEAKRKFKVYPSAYANGWLVRTYKKRGGRFRMGVKRR